MFESINPATGQVIVRTSAMPADVLAAALEEAGTTAMAWARVDVSLRASMLETVATLLEAKREAFARLIVQEVGKPIAEARAELDKCALLCRYYSANTVEFLADELIEASAQESVLSYQPLGVVLGIMPWNFPFWQVFRFAVPVLAAGNTALLKHAPNVCGCALAIEALFQEAGYPEGVLRALFIEIDQVESVIEHEAVQGVALTGSEKAGAAVAAIAGRAIKKTVLELGGSDPYVICEDADLDLAAAKCVQSRLNNCGQTCISAKRLLVHEAVLEPFTEKVIAAIEKRRQGNPEDESINLGPMARADLRVNLQRQVDASVAAGARVLLGGQVPEGAGYYYPPSVLADVRPGMPAFDEEVFGPVVALVSVKSDDQAVELANQSAYGLGAGVFTQNIERGKRLARQLECGACFINDFVKSDPRLPFGGIRRSGYGRELSKCGIREFVNVKTICVG
ncbi:MULTISPECIES: NAD-dependent succinate-semialdehyde dehydrogenase [unclassified Lentimonas]|uniref:NAD-dependent succinate-semialdehyde dehydrogenase n=1 Tax=unclassified Lentimonas TaxID=2630993 RepID=UPI001321FBAB|nr:MULTISPECIES: NAD-dependent succinate-semialdehyde dehydrogenase [unclassified Lentimonas]CAA6694174.1 Succinate-semialdehyde dehydrogenase [NAD] (EC; Succinate-semialdehyde dehydrogenase [NAD(P)+] (EC [Lentimonas sp. CC19]CAA6694329.1 Succinate-semialdehyde dehydrogenase [NAD] (EC; Succinate-semialdehyde dehydrogenase [NAD(P)+] (EC [Lentimonas sp. CC10]CAA7070381.1 Succinate-semialdehyde dehydrogenase [NAD] (EC; Succinate-semialdehyde dehydrogenase [NAD(P)+] (EC [Lentimonas sp. CC11]